ncbi:hypothetical protein AYI68_g5864, partial [Smittium mucronatum]
MGRRIFS